MLAIFRRDFRAYFSSPLGYVFVAAFLVVMNLHFVMTNILGNISMLAYSFDFMQFLMMFLVPILTMRLLSEEFKQKTDQLIFTAPLGTERFVFGKFFAALGVFLVALSGTLFYVVIIAIFGEPSAGEIVGNYIAIIAVAMAFISIGLFISSLTQNQLIAAIVTLSVFVGLYILDVAKTSFPQEAVVNVLTWISVYDRYTSFARGLFSLADFIFYLSVCAVFIFLTVRVLEKKRWG